MRVELKLRGQCINTSFVERFNLTLRRGLASLNRKTLEAAKTTPQLEGDLYLFQLFYNLLRPHRSLAHHGVDGVRVVRTPAMAAGLTDHIWTWQEALTQPIPQPTPTPG